MKLPQHALPSLKPMAADMPHGSFNFDPADSPSVIDADAREEARMGDSRFWDWLTQQPQWPDLVDRYAESRIGEHYVRIP